ncbi:MAG: hypothetical protein OXH57_13105 [Ekhidna sp.]|nr:hypothetical protein [Ekhidna sp.]
MSLSNRLLVRLGRSDPKGSIFVAIEKGKSEPTPQQKKAVVSRSNRVREYEDLFNHKRCTYGSILTHIGGVFSKKCK